MDGKPKLSFETGSTPMDWTLRIVPVSLIFFGMAWCMWHLRRHPRRPEGPIRQDRQQPQSHEVKDPIEEAKRRAWIESRLVIRKVLPSPWHDGTVVFSEPIPSCKETMEVWSNMDETEASSNAVATLCEDEEQPTTPTTPPTRLDHAEQSRDSMKDVKCDSVVAPTGSRSDDDLKRSTHSRQQRRPSLISKISNLFDPDSNDEECCAICLMEYCEGDVVCTSPNEECVHAFHKECILECVVRTPQCPVCRRNYLGEETV